MIVVIVLSNTLAVAVLPPTPLGHAGLYAQKNGLGAVMALAFLFTVYGVVAHRGWRRAFMAAISFLAFALLLLSQSKTSIGLSFLMPFVAFTVVGLAYYFRANAALLLIFSAITVVVAWLFFSAVTRFDFTDLSILLFNDETYTGRTVIWAFILDVISRAPFFGQGYSSFWAIGTDSIVYREAPGFVVSLLQAHNGYLDVMVETGLAGFALLVALILAALISTARAVPLNPQLAFLCYSLMLFVICHNMLESSWFRGYSLNWLVFLIIACVPGALSRSLSRTAA
ncbi:O-antigen ligase [Labrenzia sp. VG12]|uniref:O-antigen ligase family protein n=1 Tax=Labrenzia sp. VG12 TaxID=2021862 RepID=UPI0012FD04AC|nr:O-antigen ligase family protein [Labrenzia sp. VG12]